MSSVDGEGKRYNEGKVPLELVPSSLMFAVAEVLAVGAKKYAPRNWERGMNWTTVLGCAMRHLFKWVSPMHSDFDEESKLNHLWHVAANIAMLIEYENTCKHLDDRVKYNNDPVLSGGLRESDLDMMYKEHILTNAEMVSVKKEKKNMSRFKNKAGGPAAGSGGDLVFIKPADLARAKFTGVVAEGEFVEALPNRFDEDKFDFKIIVDTPLKVTGEDRDDEPYSQEIAKGDTVVVNGAGNLNWLMQKVSPGELCQITYSGKNEIQKGARKGTLAHTFEVAYGE